MNKGIWDIELYQTGLVFLFGYIFCLAFWLFKNRTVNSFFISFVVWVVANLLMDGLEPFIFSATGNVQFDRFLWYFSFAFIDVLAIFTIFKWHQVEGLIHNRDSVVICLLLFVLMALQMLRYIERQVFETDLLMVVYREGIPIINGLGLLYLMVTSTLQGRKLRNV